MSLTKSDATSRKTSHLTHIKPLFLSLSSFISRQAVQDFRSRDAQRMSEVRAKKKKKKEEKRKQVDANDVKRKESGVSSAPYNSSRHFSTPTPTFAIGDKN